MTAKKLLTFLLALTASLQLRAQLNPSLEQRLQDTLNDMQAQYHFKGLSAAVSVRNVGTWSGTTGISYEGQPLTTDMLIGIGSNTKTFVSALMLKLHENGQVMLDDTIGTWIQGYNNINGQVTVRQLLNHTSGIYNYTNHPHLNDSIVVDLNRIWTKPEMLHYFVNAPDFAPGTGWNYSNTNYLLAGLIAEIVTGRPVHSLIRDSILTPNQLTHTYFPPHETVNDTFAHYWSDMGSGYMEDVFFPYNLYSVPDAAGCMVSTAADHVKFLQALFAGNIIRKTTIRNEMMQWVSPSTTTYGLGLFREQVLGNIIFSHGGTFLGQISSNLMDTNRNIAICVLSNQDSLSNPFTEKVVAALYKIMLTPVTAVPGSPELSAARFYPNPARGMLYLKDEGNREKVVTLTAMDGRRVYSRKYDAGERVAVDLQSLIPGLYLAELRDDRGPVCRQTIQVVQ